MGTYFHSKNFQGPKLHITVYTFAKAREKVILRPWFEFLNFLVAAFLNLLDFNNSVIFLFKKYDWTMALLYKNILFFLVVGMIP